MSDAQSNPSTALTVAAQPLPEDVAAARARLQRERLQLKLTETAVDFYATLGILDPRDLQAELDGWGFFPAMVPPYYVQSQKRGEVLPVYVTEEQLRLIRDRCRKLAMENEYAICATENRASYIVGDGLIHRATPRRKDCPPHLVERTQYVIDCFSEANELAEVEVDAVERLDKDGDAIYRFFPQKNGLLLMRVVEPEHLRSPNGSAYGPEYSFGVQTDPEDVETIVGYWVVENPLLKSNFPTFVPADEILHIKLNTPKNAKRGLPTWYAVEQNLRRAHDLLASMTSMAKTRAKIALIRKFNQTLQATANNLVQSNVQATAIDPLTGIQLNLEQLRYGTILNASKNIDYEFPGSEVDASSFVQVLQAELRSIAARLVMPEWMLSVDASNANYSSSLIAEAPSTKMFRRLQRLFASRFGESRKTGRISAVWRQLRYSIQCGVLPPDLAKWVKVQTEAPSLVVRDKQAEATSNKTYFDMRLKSPQTIQAELGLDGKQEAENFKELGIDPKPQSAEGAGQGGAQPPGGAGPPEQPPAAPAAPGLGGQPAAQQQQQDQIPGAVSEAVAIPNDPEEQLQLVAEILVGMYGSRAERMVAELYGDQFKEEATFHGPNPPGPGWTLAGTGPKGGKIWHYAGKGGGGAEGGDEGGGFFSKVKGIFGRSKEKPQAGDDSGKDEHPAGGAAGGTPKEATTAKHLSQQMASSKQYQAFGKKFEDKHADTYQALAGMAKMPVEKLKAHIAGQAQKIVDACSVRMRVGNLNAMEAILQGGRFKNLFETGKSQGLDNKANRTRAEGATMGVPADKHGAARPMYCYLSPDGTHPRDEPADTYGGVVFKFKDHVKDRSTVTFGDSLAMETQTGGQATPWSQIGHQSVDPGDLHRLGLDTLDSWDSFTAKRECYIEAQVHDGLSLEDVEEIQWPHDPPPNLRKMMDAQGIKWSVYQGKERRKFGVNK